MTPREFQERTGKGGKRPINKEAMEKAKNEIAKLELGEALYHKNLALFPLQGKKQPGRSMDLLQKAVLSGNAIVQEVDEYGHVPELKLVNKGKKPLLVTEGEILVGAKQNRVVNLTVIVASGKEIALPVSCVEQGRWNYDSKNFTVGKTYAPAELRAEKTRSFRKNYVETGEMMSNQGQVWQRVGRILSDFGVESATDCVNDAFEAAEERVEDYQKELKPPARTRGIVVAIDGEIVGLELFDSASTMRYVWKRLLSGYALEAVRRGSGGRKVQKRSAEAFLKIVSDNLLLEPAERGLGDAISSLRNDFTSSGVWYSGSVRHLSAFAV